MFFMIFGALGSRGWALVPLGLGDPWALGDPLALGTPGPWGPLGLGDPWALGTPGPWGPLGLGDPWALGTLGLGDPWGPYVLKVCVELIFRFELIPARAYFSEL